MSILSTLAVFRYSATCILYTELLLELWATKLLITLYWDQTSVHIIAQPANQYIVAFCIAISYDIYSHTRWRQSSDANGGRTSIYWSDFANQFFGL